MNCALRTIVCVFVTSFLVFAHNGAVSAKSEKDHATAAPTNNAPAALSPDQFKWNEHNKLSWSDFRGPVNAVTDESAAATHCSIGFKTVRDADGTQRIVVYNTFYSKLSWVRSDARINSILTHEQGHFDLCEVYTRKLRERMNNFNFGVADVRTALIAIYDDVTNEYQARQQAYEEETSHGTNIPVQQRWTASISRDLNVTGQDYAMAK